MHLMVEKQGLSLSASVPAGAGKCLGSVGIAHALVRHRYLDAQRETGSNSMIWRFRRQDV